MYRFKVIFKLEMRFKSCLAVIKVQYSDFMQLGGFTRLAIIRDHFSDFMGLGFIRV